MYLLQTPAHVALLNNETRIVPLDGRPHLPEGIRQWLGDSRGHWEGDTLVVETINFTDKQTFLGFSDFPQGALHLVERFTRIGPDQIDYQFTFTDSTTWTRPWTLAIPVMKKDTGGPAYTWVYLDWACHEGNYSLANTLSVFVGLRALERPLVRSEDDAKATNPANLNSHSPNLQLGKYPVALRFTEIRIPKGARIEQAYVQFTAQNDDTEPTDLIIQAEPTGNARPLRVTNDLASRTSTSASVTWAPEPWEVAGERSERQRTPDLAALIQEVVDRPDWQAGNALVLLFGPSDGGQRDARSFDGAGRRLEHAPALYIELADDAPSPGSVR